MTKEKNIIMDESNYDPYEELANAVVIQACEDYKRVYVCHLCGNGKGKRIQKQLKELEAFFRSDWYKTLTEVDGEYLMQRLQEEVHAKNNKKTK